MTCEAFEIGGLDLYRFVVILSRYQDKWLLCRHRQRSTWENPGGHIEPGETPLEAAKRELYEESGALDFELVPLLDYRVKGEASGGRAYLATISKLGELPQSEIAEITLMEAYPPLSDRTYPEITEFLLPYALKYFDIRK